MFKNYYCRHIIDRKCIMYMSHVKGHSRLKTETNPLEHEYSCFNYCMFKHFELGGMMEVIMCSHRGINEKHYCKNQLFKENKFAAFLIFLKNPCFLHPPDFFNKHLLQYFPASKPHAWSRLLPATASFITHVWSTNRGGLIYTAAPVCWSYFRPHVDVKA